MSKSNERGGRRVQAPTRGFPTGVDLIRDPALNKGTAFTREEREILGLQGLLPPQILSQEIQLERALANVREKDNDLERYTYLINLFDRNETLFYRLLIDNMEELMPIVYTPTVGQACQQYGFIFQRPRGLYISSSDRGRVKELLRNWPYANVRVIVVTDGERILGLGDLGAYGMGIPVGKLALYTACAGIYPSMCLPVVLDVGTNNEKLLKDALYLGLKQHRLRGEMYDDLVEEFVEAVREVFPKAVIQFEDFANSNAFRLLHKYRRRACVFNDDIQGTGAVALAGLYASTRISGVSMKDQKVVFLGAGEAGMGIAGMVVTALKAEGLSEEEAKQRCWFVDSKGLVVKERSGLSEHKKEYAHDHPPAADLLSAVEALKPTAIIGVSGQPGTFTAEVLKAMAQFNKRPVIFALSNPTSKSECTAEEAYRHSKGKAVFASGSPFKPVEWRGRLITPGQGNNAYIFPGVGLGIAACEARHITDEMFSVAARTLAQQVSEEDLARGSIYPPLSKIREVSKEIALAVIETAYAEELAQHPRPEDMQTYLNSHIYHPDYHTYV